MAGGAGIDSVGQAGVGSGGIQGWPRIASRRASITLRACMSAVKR